MQPFENCSNGTLRAIETVFTDIDDTLTTGGRLPAVAYTALERLDQAGISVVPVTGRPAGWCDMIARFWPVQGVIGENGAFYFSYGGDNKKMKRVYWQADDVRRTNQKKLSDLKAHILETVPGAAVSADQAYRESDLAIDFCEDVAPLSQDKIDTIVRLFEETGATAKVSSIHVNGWFGDFDKLTMTKRFVEDLRMGSFDVSRERFIFVGDSPNDAPMFKAFKHSIGVANVKGFADRMDHLPAWVTSEPGGAGFAQVADRLLEARGA